MQVLHGHLELHEGQVVVTPFSHNADFSRGKSDQPDRAKFPWYQSSPTLLTPFFLRQLLLERVLSFNATAEGCPKLAGPATVDIICELIRLEWPVLWIGRILQNIPRRHKSTYLSFLRLFGRVIRSLQDTLLHLPYSSCAKAAFRKLTDSYHTTLSAVTF